MVSIEDAQSHVLAYSASNDEADELRRLSILGRAGPPEHLEWIGQWGIFDALRASGDVVRVAERPELGLRPRLCGRHPPAAPRRRPRHRCSPAPSGCSRARGRWPTTPRRCCAVRRCWRPASCRGWRRRRRRTRCGCRNCSACADDGRRRRRDRARARHRRRRPRRGHRLRCAPTVTVPAGRRAGVERQRFSPRRAGHRARITGVRAVPAHRQGRVGDVVDPRHHRRPATELGLELRAVIAAPATGLAVRRPPRAPRWTGCSTARTGIPARSVR